MDSFWSRDPGTVKGNFTMVKSLGKAEINELVLDTWLSPMGPFPLVDEVGMSLVCTTLIFSLIKVRHAEHLQWDSMRKAQTDWENIYGEGSLIMGYTIYSRGGKILMHTACTTRGPWFEKSRGDPS